MTTVVENGQAWLTDDEIAAIRGMSIPRTKEHQAHITIRGITPLIVHRFSEKARAEMEGKQTGKASAAKGLRDLDQEARDAAYILPGREDMPDGLPGKYYFPASAFKHAFLYGVSLLNDVKKFPKTKATAWFFVVEDPVLTFDEMVVRSDVVTLPGSKRTVHRPMFRGWGCELAVTFNTLSEEQAVAFLDNGGRFGGIGEWRPTAPKNKSGSYGRFEVVSIDEHGSH